MTATYTIAIIPPPEIWMKIVGLREQIRPPLPDDHILEYPHINLQDEFRTKDPEALVNDLEEAISSHRPPSITFNGIQEQEPGTIIATVRPNKPLQDIHAAIIESVRQYRTPYTSPEHLRKRDSFPHLRLHGNLTLYGMPYAQEYYNPHLTLGRRLTKRQMAHARELAAGLSLPSFSPSEAFVTFTDDEKQASGVYARFKLGTRSAHGARGSDGYKFH